MRRVATGLQRRLECGQQQGRQSGRGPGPPLPPDPQNSCISFLAVSLNMNFSVYSFSFKILLNDSLFNYQHQLANNFMNKWFSACL